jgi:hypothetical protein
MPNEFQPPPWTVFVRGDGLVDILPAGRPGTIIERVPEKLGRKLVLVANAFSRGGRIICPRCGMRNAYRRTDVGFEHEMICPDCNYTWEH